MNWKFTDATNTVVFRVNEDGSGESCLIEAISDWLAEGNMPDPVDPPTAEDILSKAKAERQALVDSIVVTTQSGKQFDGNEISQDRMNKAISVAVITGLASCTWVLADNVPTVVTVDELKEALALSFQAMGAVWAKPYEDAQAPTPIPEPTPEPEPAPE